MTVIIIDNEGFDERKSSIVFPEKIKASGRSRTCYESNISKSHCQIHRYR